MNNTAPSTTQRENVRTERRRGLGRSAIIASAMAAMCLPFVGASPAAAAPCAPVSVPQGDYQALRFVTTGTCEWAPPQDGLGIQYVLVGGGGGGGRGVQGGNFGGGGGGGAGGFLTGKATVTGQQSIVVGAGGAIAAKGADTSAFSLTAIGGGYSSGGAAVGGPGGSGGGGSSSGNAWLGGAGTAGQGNAGGRGWMWGSGGGGGGAGGAGYDGTARAGQWGGIGVQSPISGNWLAGGGGSGSKDSTNAAVLPQPGGGGRGGGSNAFNGGAGQPNTGGGAGGGRGGVTSGSGGVGGSGVVELRYLLAPSFTAVRADTSIEFTTPPTSTDITGYEYSINGTDWFRVGANESVTLADQPLSVTSVSLRATNGVSGPGLISTENLLPGPNITTEPQDASALPGETQTFTVEASPTNGGTLSYQWQKSSDGGWTWSNVSSGSGGTTDRYTTATLSLADSGTRFRVRVTNNDGGSSATLDSSNALLTVQGVEVGWNWSSRSSAADNGWRGVTYGNGVYVAVATSGSGNRVMTSPDGINWTARSSAADNEWTSVAYGHGLFVAVARTGSGNRVMTSPDGITWTSRSSAADKPWQWVTYGEGKFVAVAYGGGGDQVMTSTDGINWATSTTPANNWYSATYGNGQFVAVAGGLVNNDQVMTSPDGITWTPRATPTAQQWNSIAYGNGTFVAVGDAGSGQRVMTSTDGINWTLRNTPADNNWVDVTFGDGLFIASANSGTGNRIMTSPDGIAWTLRTTPDDNAWVGTTYGNGRFVAIAGSGTGNRVMTSNSAFVNQVKSPDDNATLTNTIQLVPASGTTPSDYVIYNNTQVRLNNSPNGQGGTTSTRWAIWGYMWADKTLTLANSNTIPISLATYQNAGSCTTLSMPAKDCPRALGTLTPGKSMPFRASYKVGGTWENTPIVTINRPLP